MTRFLLSVSVLGLLLGCADEEGFVGGVQKEAIENLGVQEITATPDGDIAANGAADAVKQRRHINYDAEIELEVGDFAEFRGQIPSMVELHGGYISDVKIDQFQFRDSTTACRTGRWQLRIKSTQFEKFIGELSQLGLMVSHQQTAKDMTEEFVDLEARITNKKRMEGRVLNLIDESRRSLTEVVSLERELSRIRQEIERMQGRLNYIRDRTEYSTLTLVAREFAEPESMAALPFGARIATAWNQSLGCLEAVVSATLVLATYLLPWVVAFSIFVAPLVWLWNRWWQLRVPVAS